MSDTFKILITGLVGATAVGVTPPIAPEDIGTIGQILIQIVIGIVTIIQLFRKPNKK